MSSKLSGPVGARDNVATGIRRIVLIPPASAPPLPPRTPISSVFHYFSREPSKGFDYRMKSHLNRSIVSMPWESSEEAMGGPREMRIHVQRVIAIPAPRRAPAEPLGPYPPPPPPSREQNDESAVVHQFVPQPAPTQEMEQPEGPKMQMEGTPMQAMPMNLPWGLTPEDLQAIHRTAEEAAASHQREQQIDNDMQEVKTIVNTLAAAAEAEAAEEQRRQSSESEQEPEEAGTVSARAPRTLLLPQEMPLEERPHYLQPRSVRSVENVLHREKRVKRCACNCA